MFRTFEWAVMIGARGDRWAHDVAGVRTLVEFQDPIAAGTIIERFFLQTDPLLVEIAKPPHCAIADCDLNLTGNSLVGFFEWESGAKVLNPVQCS